MVLESKVMGGFKRGGGALVHKGRNELEYRALGRGEREFVDAIVKARLAVIVEPDPPAKVIPLPLPSPAESAAKPMKRRATPRPRAVKTG